MGRRILTDAGYEVITVNNGSAALKKIHESQPDLIVLDVYMPGYGGLEVCQRLKESKETMRIPVLLTVGKMEPFKADEAKRVRADAHIVKPFEASELLAALAKLEDRIVPQGDSPRGRKGKKPSFWHGEDEKAAFQSEWTESVAYLAQVKQRKGHEDVGVSPEPVENPEPEQAPVPVARAFPRVPEATEELPVIADGPSAESVSAEREMPAVAAEEPALAADAEAGSSEATTLEAVSSDTQQLAENIQTTIADPQPTRQDAPTSTERETGAVPVAEETADLNGAKEQVTVAAPAAGRWVAENVALGPEEAAIELEQEMHAAEAAQKAQAESAVPSPAGSPAQPRGDQTDGATFAAAAAASASGTVTHAPLVGSDEVERAVVSEAAAAWENWQQIRESVMHLENSEVIAETVAQAVSVGMPQESSSSTPANEPSAHPEPAANEAIAAESPNPESSSGFETGALASIVDTVLAELKPKLMEEIAKKLKR
jgi:CheY-like chemotaxis protein